MQLEAVTKEEDKLIVLLEKTIKRKRELQTLLSIPLETIPKVAKQKLKPMRSEIDEDYSTSEDSDYQDNPKQSGKTKRGAKSQSWEKEPKPKKLRESKVCHICHQQFHPTNLIQCSATYTNKKCNIGVCRPCLVKRHGENYTSARASKQWVCPRCRGSCGKGCVICCTCGTCRKKANLPIISKIFKRSELIPGGFDNVHDQLVHMETGESAEEIKARKLKFPWGAFLTYVHDNADNSQDIQNKKLEQKIKKKDKLNF
eukprot:TRINITY_DN16230_c0_g1_i1.p1 TRINITY_DN16230_c0_g1~~TRINITY_DN16230_c0_g1_i1.p1  ORF type:complete len:257 (+),score=35.74 TRINITY_DN16230_c0_g1_i1:63-833(+)